MKVCAANCLLALKFKSNTAAVIGEEATELVMAVKDQNSERIVAETADLWFHCLVVLTEHGLRPEQVLAELARREGISGLQEKASRQP